jgi:hypothetical protein
LSKEQTKSTTIQSKESIDKTDTQERSKNLSKKSQTSNIYSNIFGNTPEKEPNKPKKKINNSKKIEKIIIKKSGKNLFLIQKSSSNKSNSSLSDYPKVDFIRQSMKEINFHKKFKKEQVSDSIILEMQKEINKEKAFKRNVKAENKLKNIVKKANFNLLAYELPPPNQLFPEKIKSKKTWTRPSSPNKRTLNFLQTYNKSAKNTLINNLKKNIVPHKGGFIVDNSSKNNQHKLKFQIFNSNQNLFGSGSISKPKRITKNLNM